MARSDPPPVLQTGRISSFAFPYFVFRISTFALRANLNPFCRAFHDERKFWRRNRRALPVSIFRRTFSFGGDVVGGRPERLRTDNAFSDRFHLSDDRICPVPKLYFSDYRCGLRWPAHYAQPVGLPYQFLGWPQHSAAFRRWGSVASSVFVTLLRGGVHLILANPPWRHLQERAEKIPGDKKHVKGMLSQSHYVAQFNPAHTLPNIGPEVVTRH
jgi:hypothetical protein